MSAHYVLVNLPQGTPEWREWRHGGIGASEASTVLGENPFKSADQLFQEKRGPVPNFVANAAMELGTKLEPVARERYIYRTGKNVQPACLQSLHHPWLRASLDGLGARGDSVVEIKCGRSAYQRTAKTGRVPSYYYAQIQHILAITHLPSMDFWAYWPRCPEILIEVPRNDNYIDQLIRLEGEFWTEVQNRCSILRIMRSTLP